MKIEALLPDDFGLQWLAWRLAEAVPEATIEVGEGERANGIPSNTILVTISQEN